MGVPNRVPKVGKRACEACAVVGPKTTLQLCLRRTGKVPSGMVANTENVCSFMRGLETADRESFWALHLDVRHNIVDADKIAIGSQSGVEVHPREVFKSALLSGASALIFVHNHPSANPTPSRQDTELTRRLKEVGDLVGIPVLDHVVIGRDEVTGGPSCSSMSHAGLMGTYPLKSEK